MTTVFISYSRKDLEQVRRLHAALAAREREAWVDWEGIPPSAEWMHEIRSAIDAAQAFAFVLSPDSLASPVCQDELQHAVAQGKRLIPLVCTDVDPAAVPAALARLNWIFCRAQDDFEAAVTTLLAAVDTDLDHLHAHTRLLLRAVEWDARGRDAGLTLRGAALTAAERWLAAGARREPGPTGLQTRFILDSRRSADRRRLTLVVGAGSALVVLAVLAVATLIARRNADHQQTLAIAGRLAADADLARSQQPARNADDPFERSLLLAAESARQLDAAGARALQTDLALRRALATRPGRGAPLERGVSRGSPMALWVADDGSLKLASADLLVQRWDAQGRWLPAPDRRVSHGVKQLRFAAGGRFVLSTGFDSDPQRVDVWDADTLQSVATLRRPDARVATAAIDAGATVLAVSYDLHDTTRNRNEPESTRVHDLAVPGYPEVARLPPSRELVVGADGTWLALLLHDGGLAVWRLSREGGLTVEPVAVEAPEQRVLRIAASSDGKHLVGWLDYTGTWVWKSTDWRSARVVEAGEPFAFDMAGQRVVVSAPGDAVRVLIAGDEREIAHLGYVPYGAVALSADGNTLALTPVGGGDREVEVWRLDEGASDILQTPDLAHLGDFAFSADEMRLHAVAGSTRRAWSLADRREAPPQMLSEAATLATHSADGRVLAWSTSREVAVVDVASGAVRRRLPLGGPAVALALSPDGGSLAAALQDGGLLLWPAPDTGTPLRLASPGVIEPQSLAVASGGQMLVGSVAAAASRAGQATTVLRWQPPQTEPLARTGLGTNASGLFAAACAFSADARLVASPGNRGGISIRDTATGEVQVTVDHRGGYPLCAFSADNRWFANGAADAVRVWDLQTGTEVGRIEGLSFIRRIVFSPSGRYLATSEGNGRVRAWLLTPADLAARACSRIERNLGPEAWREHFLDRPYRPTCPGRPEPDEAPPR